MATRIASLAGLGSLFGSLIGNYLFQSKDKSAPNISEESIQRLQQQVDKLDENVVKNAGIMNSILQKIEELIKDLIVPSKSKPIDNLPPSIKEELSTKPALELISEVSISETKPITPLLNSQSGTFLSKIKHFLPTRKTILLSFCAFSCYFMFKFITRRKIKFFIGDDFKQEMKLAIINQLSNKIYAKARFEQVDTPQNSDMTVINGDLSLRNDNIVPKDDHVYLSICNKSTCALRSNEVRIIRLGSFIKLDSVSIENLIILMNKRS